MREKIFANQRAIAQAELVKYAEVLDLDTKEFKECLDSGKRAGEIKKRMAEGQKAGITGTPAFLLGYSESGGKVKAVKKLVGAQPYSAFKTTIEELLVEKR